MTPLLSPPEPPVPIRLYEPETLQYRPRRSGAAAIRDVLLPATIVLVSVAVPKLYRPPPLTLAELPLTVQLVSVAVPPCRPGRRRWPAELPLTVQSVSVMAVPTFVQAAAVVLAELPLRCSWSAWPCRSR